MPTTVVESIALTLVSRLEGIVIINEVIRPTRLGTYTPKDMQLVVLQSNPERIPELDCPGNPPASAWRQVFNIHVHLLPSDTDTTATDELVNTVIADVIEAVCAPATTWHTFGGNAIDAQWIAFENIDNEGVGPDGVNMQLAVTYRTDENNPYNVRA